MAARLVCVTRCCGCWRLRDATLIIGLSLQVFHLLYLTAVCGWAAGLAPRPPDADRLLAVIGSARGIAVPACGLLLDTALMVGVLVRLRVLVALWLAWYACLLVAGLASVGVLLAGAVPRPQPGHIVAVLAYLAAIVLLAYWWLVVLSLLCNFRELDEPRKVGPPSADAAAETPA